MRILIHDYAGHPFQVQLSRQLAKRGHQVLHAFCGSTLTPQGSFEQRADDPKSFAVECIDLGTKIPKTNYFRRLRMEASYGKKLIEVCERYRPEVVLSGNTPSLPQSRLARYCKRNAIKHVFWVQDIYGIATYKLLKKRVPVLGQLVGKYFIGLDRNSAQLSDSLVVISEDFVHTFQQWGIKRDSIHVVQNWSVLEELPTRPRENPWSQKQSLTSGPRIIYSGTLAMKHNPALLLALAKVLEQRGVGQLVVVSEGSGVEWLEREGKTSRLSTIQCLGFQPFEEMADVLGSADILVAVLEPDAGVFSVPSKVLSYMCAGRPILAAMPTDNLAARLIAELDAGRVVEPDDIQGFCNAASELLDSEETRAACGKAARKYADENFDIDHIADRFEAVLAK